LIILAASLQNFMAMRLSSRVLQSAGSFKPRSKVIHSEHEQMQTVPLEYFGDGEPIFRLDVGFAEKHVPQTPA